MSTNKTPNLSLHAWEETDRFDRGEFNDNFSALDTAVGGNTGKITALASRVGTLEGKAGNVRLVTGTYVGTGAYGTANPMKFSFNAPLLRLTLLQVGQQHDACNVTMNAGATMHMANENASTSYALTTTWTSTSVSWYYSDAGRQFNRSGVTYRYFAYLAV